MKIELGETIRLKPEQCPVCKTTLDATTILSSAKGRPDPGDFSVCIACGTMLRFEIGLHLKAASSDDLRELYDDDPRAFAIFQTATVVAKQRIMDARRYRYRSN